MGHIVSQCLNKMAMILRDNGEVVSDSDGDDLPALEVANEGGGI